MNEQKKEQCFFLPLAVTPQTYGRECIKGIYQSHCVWFENVETTLNRKSTNLVVRI